MEFCCIPPDTSTAGRLDNVRCIPKYKVEMLSYVITSRHRRALLKLLWHECVSGTCQELADLGGMALSVAQRELGLMEKAGYAVVLTDGRAHVYAWNPHSAYADAMKALMAAEFGEPTSVNEQNLDDPVSVRRALVDVGAPIRLPSSSSPTKRYAGPVEVLLARALRLSHTDSTVALVLPVVLWSTREHWDFDRLSHEAGRLGERESLGMFLDLTGSLAENRGLRQQGRGLSDGRRSKARPYFVGGPAGEFARRAEELNTPKVARKWNFTMNMPMDAFRSQFEKHAHA